MENSLDEQYLVWLYSQAHSLRLKNPTRTYWGLFRQLYFKEFIWLIPNDDNRAEDGRDLRYEFIDQMDIENAPASWMRMGCNVLEMLTALSRRLAFEGEGHPADWLWLLLVNLDLSGLNDRGYSRHKRRVDEILENMIWRTYEPDGRGGLFPLRHPVEDQREVEVWYQLCAYLLEHD